MAKTTTPIQNFDLLRHGARGDVQADGGDSAARRPRGWPQQREWRGCEGLGSRHRAWGPGRDPHQTPTGAEGGGAVMTAPVQLVLPTLSRRRARAVGCAVTQGRGRAVARLLAEVQILRAARVGVTIEQLAADTGVGTRTIRRDLEILQDVHVPLVDERAGWPRPRTALAAPSGGDERRGVDDRRHLRAQIDRPDRRRRRAEVRHAPDRARARVRRAQGLDRRRRARLRRRRDQRRRVREPARLPAADERAEAAAAVPGARHVGGVAARPRSDRDGVRAEAARARPACACSSTSRTASGRSTARPTRSCCR